MHRVKSIFVSQFTYRLSLKTKINEKLEGSPCSACGRQKTKYVHRNIVEINDKNGNDEVG
jgi:hypothetical protein